MGDFEWAKMLGSSDNLDFDASSCALYADRGDYRVIVKKRKRGNSSGHTDAYVVLSGAARRISTKYQLRSKVEIAKHFNAFPELSVCV